MLLPYADCGDEHAEHKWRHLRWLPVGTLAANMLAVCAGSGLIAAMLLRRSSSAEEAIFTGVLSGLLGSLSTVSTFAEEVSAAALQCQS